MNSQGEETGHQRLAEYLADKDVPCPSCKYNLRGLQGDQCPECNQKLLLGVQLAEPKIGTLIGICLGLGTGIGFNLFVLCMILKAHLEGMSVTLANWDLIVGISSVILISSLYATIRYRARVRRLSPLMQVGAVLMAWLVSVCTIIVFVAMAE